MVVKKTRSRKYYKRYTAKQRGGARWESCDRIDRLQQRLQSGVKAYIYIHGLRAAESGKEYLTSNQEGDKSLLLQATTQAKGELKINLKDPKVPIITCIYYGLETSIPIPKNPEIKCPRTFIRSEDETTDITFTFNAKKAPPGDPAEYEDIAKIKFSYRGDVYIDGDSGRRFTWYLNIKELKIPIYLTVEEAGNPGAPVGAPKDPFAGPGQVLGGRNPMVPPRGGMIGLNGGVVVGRLPHSK